MESLPIKIGTDMIDLRIFSSPLSLILTFNRILQKYFRGLFLLIETAPFLFEGLFSHPHNRLARFLFL